MSETTRVTCPHCGSVLEIDVASGSVVSHEPPADDKAAVDFESRLRALEDEKRRASDRMDEAMRREKAKKSILEDRFRRLMDEAPDDDEPPPQKDIDL